jgi:hypothetical protein
LILFASYLDEQVNLLELVFVFGVHVSWMTLFNWWERLYV